MSGCRTCWRPGRGCRGWSWTWRGGSGWGGGGGARGGGPAGAAPPDGGPAPAGRLLGCEPTPTGLRLGLERCYRQLARLADTPQERIALVDRANAVRPRTLF
ncbi:hypothetical protein K7G98_31450 [Saccharothrix sp. MB29]|nr:hypothetical protein [Saccharothrix sp. MB29]